MSVRAIKNILDDNQIKQFIIPRRPFLKLLNNNFKKHKQIPTIQIFAKRTKTGIKIKIKKYKIPISSS